MPGNGFAVNDWSRGTKVPGSNPTARVSPSAGSSAPAVTSIVTASPAASIVSDAQGADESLPP